MARVLGVVIVAIGVVLSMRRVSIVALVVIGLVTVLVVQTMVTCIDWFQIVGVPGKLIIWVSGSA